MPLKTINYFLEAFLDGDAYSAIADKRRFNTIDNQMWRIAEIVGDGRIEGWEVQETTFPDVKVTAGSGIIDGYFINTFDDQDFELSTNGVFYFYAQRRVGLTGTEGPKSDLANIGYTDDGAPANVIGFSATSTSPFIVLLTWTANTENDLDHYDVERSTDGVEYELVGTADSDETLFEDSVDEDTTYYYNFYAVDQTGNRSTAPASDTVTTSLSSVPPPNPIEVQMPHSEYAINVLWKRPPTLPLAKTSHYLLTWVELATDDSEISSTQQTRIINRNLYYDRIDDLTVGQRYKVILQSVDDKGRESTGVVKTVTPQPNAAPPDPEGVAWSFEEAPGGVEINLSWTEGDNPYDPATSYRFKIYVTPEDGQEAIGIDIPIGYTEEQVSLYTYDLVNYIPIQEDELITLRLTALDQAGNESFGTWLRFETALLSLPRRLRNLSSEFIPETQSILIEWDNWPETNDIRLLVLYDDQEDAYIGDLELLDERIGTRTRYVIENVNLNYIYTISITPFNKDGVAGPTTTFSETTVVPDLPLPAPPTNVEIKAGDSQLSLKWDQSSTAYTYTYQLYRKEGGITVDEEDWILLDEMPSTVTTFDDYGLENGQIYSYYIAATDVYGRQSLHLPDGAVNLNFVQSVPRQEGLLTQVTNVDLTLLPSDEILVTWDSLAEEFDSFSIYRSINNLHSWELISTVPKDTFSYTDITLPLVDGTVFYYVVSKTFNDSDILVQSTTSAPENSLYLATVTTTDTEMTIDVSDRRDIEDMEDPIAEYTATYLLPHRHKELLDFDPDRIDLNPQLIVTDWTTVDGKIWFTEEEDISGTSYIVKVNDRIPRTFYTVDSVNRRLIFSEPIASVDDFGVIIGTPPEIEVQVLGIEEVQNILDDDLIEGLHARQVAFGDIAKDQLPSINHEGRIREKLLPKRFTLERLSNHQFIVPQASTDSSKTFGDGTTFYAVTESDGQIEEMFDFDLQDDGETVGFRRPDYSDATIGNLKQNTLVSNLETVNDIANDYEFDTDYLWASHHSWSFVFNKNTLADTDLYNHADGSVLDMTIDKDAQIAYLVSGFPASNSFYKLDIPTGEITLIGTINFTSQWFITAFEYNPDDQKFYALQTNDIVIPRPMKLSTVDLDTLTVTDIAAASNFTGDGWYSGMTYDQDNGKMRIVTNESLPNSQIGEIDLTTANVTFTASTPPGLDTIAYDYDSGVGDHNLWSANGTTVYKIRPSDGDATNVGSLTRSVSAFVTAPIDESFYMTAEDSIPGSDRIRMGDFVGLQATTYLRLPVDVWPEAEISSSQLVFTAHNSEASAGDNVRLKISILDPGAYADSVDLEFETIKAVSTLGFVLWVPPAWSTSEQSDSTTVDVTSLIQTFVNSDSYSQGRHIIFKIETLGTTTQGHHRTAETWGADQPYLEIDYTVSRAEVDSDTGGFQSNKSYRLSFEFEDDEPTRWVRITTENTPIKGNPLIDLGKRLRFRILNTEASIYLSLGIRETGQSTGTIGEDGGTTGPIEWVGVSSLVTDDLGNVAPIGTLIPASEEWQNVDIDLTRAGTRSYINGNGVLARGFGVLEHIAFTVNPDDSNATGPFEIYIDEMQQISDLLVAGTSQGILLSRDFGVNWTVARLTTTPVHKFYKSSNGFLWAISANEVLLSVDPAYWFLVGGTTGVQYIRDIVEDADRDMFVSTDKGVYWLEVTLLNKFAQFRQTQPINAFSTDAYALYHYNPSSGISEIWVSTEVGIYRTADKGVTWQDTGMDTAGLVAYQLINIGTDSEVIVGNTRKHIVRKMPLDSNFTTIANFEEQHDIFDIWVMEFFANRLYVSTGSGVYMNSEDTLLDGSDTEIPFKQVLSNLNRNGFTGIAFSLNSVDTGFGETKLFIGQENRLATATSGNATSIKRTWNKEIPSFFVNDNDELPVGYIYNAFNNVVCFREPQEVNKIISAAYLPRRIWIALNGGWAFTQPSAEVFVYRNGIPTWLDWALSDDDIIAALTTVQSQLLGLPSLTTFNSLQPDATTYLEMVLEDIETISAIDDNGDSGVNSTNIVKFMEDYSRFLKLITPTLRDREVDGDRVVLQLPTILLAGIPREQRVAGNRAAILEEREEFEADDPTGLFINTTDGSVDFLQAYANSTDPEVREKYTFEKFEKMEITIFNANVANTGEYNHRELESIMEGVNSGLTSHLARAMYTNFIKAGIFMEGRHHNMFSTYNASNIQSKYYAAWTNAWYDVLNSTIDYDTIIAVDSLGASRFATDVAMFVDDPYFNQKIWVGTDSNILQYAIGTDGKLTLEDIVKPGGIDNLYIWDITIFRRDTVYVVAEDQSKRESKIYKTVDFGVTWTEEELFNLPERFFNLHVIAGNLVSGSERGMFYSDNNFGQWYETGITNASTNAAEAALQPLRHVYQTTFLIVESDRYFYRTNAGFELFSTGRITNNGCTVVNAIARFKNLTYAGTDVGIYNDGNSILSDNIAFGVEQIEDDIEESIDVEVNAIAPGQDALYAAASNSKIYRYYDEGDGEGNVWKSYELDDFGPIHKLLLYEASEKHWLYAFSYDQIRLVDVTPDEGVFG